MTHLLDRVARVTRRVVGPVHGSVARYHPIIRGFLANSTPVTIWGEEYRSEAEARDGIWRDLFGPYVSLKRRPQIEIQIRYLAE
ncbi:MAG: hypothetical protein ACE5I7_19300 [Candidatus Binatia bacterium]